ncbi:MAG TPA: hypothetical protein VF178_04180 [Gemmatimonadaceae bacterium]
MRADERTLQQILRACRAVRSDPRADLSTSERLAAALVLKRVDVLATLGYTAAQAKARIGLAWATLLPYAAAALAEEDARRTSTAERSVSARRTATAG